MRFFSESRIFLVVSVSLYLVMKALFAFDIISPYIQQICLYAVIVALTAIGLNVIYGYTGQFSLGHAAFYGIGAYASAYLTKILAIEGVLPFIPVLVFCGVVSGIMGYLIGIPILRLRDDFLAIATLGFGTLVR
ncbi:MAG TPA: branched-chain amino acid ABC transporter permease, partial [Syntrophorhabdaceae bacterium]|nr:branched-chain amino acid ABC transporter permease [Syntrophorhabdaceae bacterium]